MKQKTSITSENNKDSESLFMKELKNPGPNHRPLPFWSWNDQLDQEELKIQIDEMDDQGLGGYFMHARSGLVTPYLSEEWFACIGAGIEKAHENGMEAWIYDEEGWPSGFAGGLVPEMSKDYHAKYIQLKSFSSLEDSKACLAKEDVIGLYIHDEVEESYKQISSLDDLSLGKSELIFLVVKQDNPYYVDTMNKEAIEAFTKVTHDAYYERFGSYFGQTVKGFFTDEPRLTCDRIGDIAWSDCMPEVFKNRFGYDIFTILPSLFLEIGDYESYRYNFWMTVNDLFVHGYMETLYDWCQAHDCQLTGHMMMEESIFSQMTSTGGVMPFYEYMHMPGIDWLRRPIQSPVIAKQVGSVAAQLGIKSVLSESFALCGWDVTLEELKWIAEWQFVNGVNRICQHLEGYTIRGSRKRDYPPSLFTQQTWWKKYKPFNDYLGRLNLSLSQGYQEADALLLHPMRSGYLVFDGTRSDAIRKLDDDFTLAAETLSGNHISYHFGDETIVEKYGQVKDGKFIVGQVSYESLVLPTMYAIDENTLELINLFLDQGGQVYCIGELPYFTNGSETDLEEMLVRSVQIEPHELRQIMKQRKSLKLSIADSKGQVSDIHYQMRRTDDGLLIYMINLDKEKAYHTTVKVYDLLGQVSEINMNNGMVEPVDYKSHGGSTSLGLKFDPMQSHVLLIKPMKNLSLRDEDQWTLVDMDDNSLTLDMCKYSINGGDIEGPMAVIHLQQKLMDLQKPCMVDLFFDVDIRCEVEKIKRAGLVVESMDSFDIHINGENLVLDIEGYWKDKSFDRMDVTSHLQEGHNEIHLRTEFKQPQKVYDVLYGTGVYETEKNKITYDVELENIYLVGDFSVYSDGDFRSVERQGIFTDGPFYLDEMRQTFDSLELTKQGLLYFAGSISLEKDIFVDHIDKYKEYLIDLTGQRSSLIEVWVNGNKAHESYWAPYQKDIKSYLQDGNNRINLKIYGSNRNLFGPHHHIDGECYNVGPDSFTGKWSWVERKSEADATEIFDRDKNYWTDAYCFVTFGIV